MTYAGNAHSGGLRISEWRRSGTRRAPGASRGFASPTKYVLIQAANIADHRALQTPQDLLKHRRCLFDRGRRTGAQVLAAHLAGDAAGHSHAFFLSALDRDRVSFS